MIHYTAMQSATAACETLCNPATEVSAHYLIAADGDVVAMVPEDQRAWHAGAGAWGDVTDVNSRSIGIELDNDGFSPFAAAQMDALGDLLRGISERWEIRPARVIGHSDMAPGRKIDPGARFDWRRFAIEGFGVWPGDGTAPPDEDTFGEHMATFGYTATTDRELLLKTLRLRFRPYATGPLDSRDMGIITDLANRFPVDASPTGV